MDSVRSLREEAGPARWDFDSDEAYQAEKLKFERALEKNQGDVTADNSAARVVKIPTSDCSLTSLRESFNADAEPTRPIKDTDTQPGSVVIATQENLVGSKSTAAALTDGTRAPTEETVLGPPTTRGKDEVTNALDGAEGCEDDNATEIQPGTRVLVDQDTHGSTNNTAAASTCMEPGSVVSNTVEAYQCPNIIAALEIQRTHGVRVSSDAATNSTRPGDVELSGGPSLGQSQDDSATEKPEFHDLSNAKAQEELSSQSTQVS
jgi:hypothetical protein